MNKNQEEKRRKKRESIDSIRHERKKGLNLLFVMVVRNVKDMYRESVLGIIWTVLNPLLTMFVLSFVYSQLFGRDMPEIKYQVYVLSGMLAFNTIFRAGSSMGLSSIVGKRYLVMQTTIPITTYPRVSVYTALVNFSFSFIALIIVMALYKQPFHWTLALTPVFVIPLMLFTLGCAFVLSVVYVYFRDIQNLYNVFTTLLMYATPIFYTIDALQNPVFNKTIVYNPLNYYVQYFREIIMGHVPTMETHLIIYGVGLFMYAFGYMFIMKARKNFIFHL